MNASHPTIRLRMDAIRELCEAKGLEAGQDLAAAMGVDQSSVSRVMRGVSQPGPRFIATLCAALEAPMQQLFTIEEGEVS